MKRFSPLQVLAGTVVLLWIATVPSIAQVSAPCNEIYNGCPGFSCDPQVDYPYQGDVFTAPANIVVECSIGYGFDAYRIQVLKHNTPPNFHLINGFGCVGNNLGNDLSGLQEFYDMSYENPFDGDLNGLSAGTYYVTCRVWEAGVGVSYYSDPISFTVVNPSGGPNFKPNSTGHSLDINGTTFDFDLSVINNGNQPPPSFTKAGFYLSTNQTITPNDSFMGSKTIPALLPGSSINSNKILQEPANLPGGCYYIGYYLDYDLDITESEEGDNAYLYSNSPYCVYAKNLWIFQNASIQPTTASPGDLINLSCVVQNQGNQPAGPNTLKVFYAHTTSATGTEIGQYPLPTITANSQHAVNLGGLQIPVGASEGNRYIRIQVDAANTVIESNEGDNRLLLPITICNVPNPSFYFYPNPAEVGETVNVINSTSGASGSSWNWTFQDGNPPSYSVTGNTSVQFTSPGTKTITLTGTNTCGSNSVSQTINIIPDPNNSTPTPPSFSTRVNHPTAHAADPVNLATGAYTWQQEDLTIKALNGTWSWTRFYNSLWDQPDNPMGQNWSHSFDIRMAIDGDEWDVHHGDGHWENFIGYNNGSAQPLNSGTTDVLSKDLGTNTYSLEQTNGTVFHFASDGRLTAIADRNGNEVTCQYTGTKLTKLTFPGGRYLDIAYNNIDRIESLMDQAGRTATYTYTGNRLRSATNTRGSETRYSYSGPTSRISEVYDPNTTFMLQNVYDYTTGQLTHQYDIYANSYQFLYDMPQAGATSVVNPLNDTMVYVHDDDSRMTSMTDEFGTPMEMAYNSLHLPTAIEGAEGHSAALTYDGVGNVLSIDPPLIPAYQFTYNGLNQPLSITDPGNHVTSFTYDGNGNPLSIDRPDGAHMEFTPNSLGQITSMMDARGIQTTFSYNTFGDVISMNRAGHQIELFYDDMGRADSLVDRTGKSWTQEYDAYGNITKATDPAGDASQFEYDANGNLTDLWDAGGANYEQVFDPKDRLKELVDPLGQSHRFSYDSKNQLTMSINARDDTLLFTYGERGWMTGVTDALGSQSFGYDSVGNPTTITDALNNATNITYDALDRPIHIALPDGAEWKPFYNTLGSVDSIHDPLGNTTKYSYDALQRLEEVVSAEGHITKYRYDLAGNLIRIEHPNLDSTQITYDSLNLPETITYPGGYSMQVARDAEGNISAFTNANGELTEISRDAKYRVDSLNHFNGHVYTFQYDPVGRLTGMSNDHGPTQMPRDVLGRITQCTDPFGNEVRYAYDEGGLLRALIYPGDDTVHYAYNGAGLLKKVTDWDGNWSTRQYDANGDLISVINSNGTSTVIIRDSRRRVASYTNKLPGGQAFSQHTLTYDGLGNPTLDQNSMPLYPGMPADTQITYAYDADDRIVAQNGAPFTSNANGAITQAPTAVGTNAYTWAENDLLDTYTVQGVQSENDYNPLGQRIERRRGTDTVRYTLDVEGVITGLSEVLETRDGGGQLLQRFVYAPDGLGWQADSAGDVRFYFFDVQGNTIALCDSQGSPTDTLAYGPFGDWFTHHGDADIAFAWQGRYGVQYEGHDLYHVRARFYDAVSGRFLSKDSYGPELFDPLTLNRYTYGLNNPMVWNDPSGLKEGLLTLGNQRPIHLIGPPNFRERLGMFGEAYVEHIAKHGLQYLEVISLLPVASNFSQVAIAGAYVLQGDLDRAQSEILAAANPFGFASSWRNVNRYTRKPLSKLKSRIQPISSVLVDAFSLSKRIGKNTINIRTPDKIIHYDLVGASHKGVATPHVQYSIKNVGANGQTYFNKNRSMVRSMTRQDLRVIRNYMKRISR